MIILGLDVETTGLNADTDEITEIGAVLWDWKRKAPVKIFNELIQVESNISQEITDITGIDNELCKEYGVPLWHAIDELDKLIAITDYCMAHNAEFDRKFIDKAYIDRGYKTYPDFMWIDSRTDVPWKKVNSRKLGYLAADHGFLNPFAHRALFDVLTMLKLASLYDIDQIIERSESSVITLQAGVRFHEKDLAKSAGFHWEPITKRWLMDIKECDLVKSKFDFKTRTVNDAPAINQSSQN